MHLTKATSSSKDKFDPAVIIEIFEHWKVVMNHPTAKMDDKRKKVITHALSLKYTTEQLITAIDGCASSEWHMGTDPRNQTIYDDLELILRDAKHIDQFIKMKSTNVARPQGVSYASNGKSRKTNTDIFDNRIKTRIKSKIENQNVIDIQSRV